MTLRHWLPTRWGELLLSVIGAVLLGFMSIAGASKAAPLSLPHESPPVHAVLARTTTTQMLVDRPHPRLPLGQVPSHLRRPRRYRIHWGQTLWGIARRFHLTLKELQEANQLTSDSVILAGTSLIIPIVYRVQAGQRLDAVARRWDVSPNNLLAENQLPSAALTAGQTLVIPSPSQSPPPPLPSRGRWSNPYNLSPAAVLMIAHLVQAEAGNQSLEAQVAVAAVVLNRLKSPQFPKTVNEIIFAPGQFQTVASATFWNNPGPLSLLAAKAAATGWDPTGGALYFYNPSLPHVAWMDSLPQTAVIGSQIFSR